MAVGGTETLVAWRGHPVSAFTPTPLSSRPLTLDTPTAVRSGGAGRSIEHSAATLGRGDTALTRLLLLSDGIASSYIEQITASVADVILAGQDTTRERAGATNIAANITAATQAIEHAAGGADLNVDTLCNWHRTLMASSAAPEQRAGQIRSELGWVGGTGPVDAAFVPPPPGQVRRLLDDLILYVNQVGLDAVTQAAVAHAQFEVIHPFGDGNGRIGRVLISWILTRHLHLVTPPPVSVPIAADTAGYALGLTRYRNGNTSEWVSWFADMVTVSDRKLTDLVVTVQAVRDEWEQQLNAHGTLRRVRSDAAARRALSPLMRHLVLDAGLLSDELGISAQAANVALRTLTAAGITTVYPDRADARRGRPKLLYASERLLGLAGATPFPT